MRWCVVVCLVVLELVVTPNPTVIAQKKEVGADCCYLTATGWYHLPPEAHGMVVHLDIARSLENKPSCFHKLFIDSFDSLFERLVPTNLA